MAATVVRPTRVVWLNATGLTIEHATLAGVAARQVKGDDDFVGFTTDRELPPGALAIDIAFQAPIDPVRSRAVYSEREGDDVYAYTFFEPINARRAFPCFDEPSYKVPWQLTFHVKAAHVALGNAPLVRETLEAGGMKRVELALSRPLPSYLVAFVVGPFEVVDGGTAGRIHTPIRFIIPRGRAGELGYAKEVTPKVVAALEDYFDMAYPYLKLDVAVVPRYWGTMEHPGIVAMGQPLTLIRPDQATRNRKRGYTNILAHEMSHYWFGDFVTMAWWDDTWLNEGLGEWSDINITEAAEPTWRARDDRVDLSIQAMVADETLATHAIRQPVTARDDIERSFDTAITYFKGASVFRMFEAFVGRDRWRSFINAYLAHHAWGNASAEDFLVDLTDQLGAEPTRALRSFLDQPGVPLITAELRCQPGARPRVQLTQQRSLPTGITDPASKRWIVPVCIRYGDAKATAKTCSYLAEPSASIELGTDRCPTWLIANADATGYYRTAIDPGLARDLLNPGSAIAKAARPTPAERMMLVEDLGAAVARDELPLDKLLDLVPVIAADPDAKVAQRALLAGDVPMAGLDDATYRAAVRWYAATFRAAAQRLGWQRGPKDSEEVHQLRQRILARVATEDSVLAGQAAVLADRWLADRTGVSDDLVRVVLSVAASTHGDAARFDRMLAAARHGRDRDETTRILIAMGSFTDPAQVTKVLALVLGLEFDVRDTFWTLRRVLDRRETRDLGIAFLTEHLDELLPRMTNDDAAQLFRVLAEMPCDVGRKEQIAALIIPRAAKIGGAQNYVTRGRDAARTAIADLSKRARAPDREQTGLLLPLTGKL